MTDVYDELYALGVDIGLCGVQYDALCKFIKKRDEWAKIKPGMAFLYRNGKDQGICWYIGPALNTSDFVTVGWTPDPEDTDDVNVVPRDCLIRRPKRDLK